MRFARRGARAEIAGRRDKLSLLIASLGALAGYGAAGTRVVAAAEPTAPSPASAPAPAASPPVYETVVPAPVADAEAPREDGSASVSVVTARRTPRSGETLPKLLSELPGVNVTRYGSDGSLATLSLRGSPANQVMVYADGVPLNSALVGAVDVGLVPLTAAQRIEVYRGSSPLAFGTSAIGGVVSLTTEVPGTTQASVRSGGGSYGTWLAGGEAAYAGPRVKLVGRLALFGSTADFPYLNPNGTTLDPRDDRLVRRDNNQLAQRDAAARAELALPGRRQLALAAAAIDRDQGLPARGTLISVTARLRRRRLHGSASYQSRDDLGQGGRLRATLYTLASEQRFDDPLGEIAFVGTRTRDRSFTVGATGLASQPLGSALVLSWLADARHEAFHPRSYADSQQPGDGRRDSAALGMSAAVSIEHLALELTLTGRAELAHDRKSAGHGRLPGDPEASGTARYLLPLGRAGLVQTPHRRVRLRANAGAYARVPTLFERYGNDGLVKGAAGLIPERGLTADAGGSLRIGEPDGTLELLLDGAAFAAATRNLIHLQPEGYFARFHNVARARAVGAELSASGRVGLAHLLLQGTLMDLRDRSDTAAYRDRPLPLHPRLRGYARPELRAVPLPGGLSFGLYADAELTGARYDDPANQSRQPARVLLGAGGYLDGAALGTGMRAVVSAYNLGGHRRPEVLDYPLPGRSLFVTLHFAYPREERNP
jgi:outer membrane cobalamin receptor